MSDPRGGVTDRLRLHTVACSGSSNSPTTVIDCRTFRRWMAKRMLALSFAHSEETADKDAAIDLYRSLARDGSAEAADIKVLATLLIAAERYEEAKAAVEDGIGKFPGDASGTFLEIGLKIVEATGDRAFRKQLVENIGARGKSA